jgi:nucleoside-diphosphate-sugar epimerase
VKRVVITGAAGFIGSHLATACAARDWEVTGIDSLTDYYDPAIKRRTLNALSGVEGVRLIEADLMDVDLAETLAGCDLVFHLAAQPGVRASWGDGFDGYVRQNVLVTQRLLEACKGVDLERFVMASSSSVYGDAEALPTPESSFLRPVSPYGSTKVQAENLAYVYWRNFEVPTVGLRYFTVYGPRQRPDMAFNRVITRGLAGDQITVFGDGSQSRDFTFVDDAVSGTIAAAMHGRPGGVYNLGGGSRISLLDVLGMIEEILGQPLDIVRTEASHGDARHTAADITRANADLGYEPRHSLEDGLSAQVNWHQAVGDRSVVFA